MCECKREGEKWAHYSRAYPHSKLLQLSAVEIQRNTTGEWFANGELPGCCERDADQLAS